jgi:hypothetical protein
MLALAIKSFFSFLLSGYILPQSFPLDPHQGTPFFRNLRNNIYRHSRIEKTRYFITGQGFEKLNLIFLTEATWILYTERNKQSRYTMFSLAGRFNYLEVI